MMTIGIGIGIDKQRIVEPAQQLLLDTYGSAAMAYSLRKLRTAYSGACIRVRRSSDNTEQDFGFASNVLDTAAVLTFVGANDGHVVTWYDQSGNGYNFTQATANKQPRIVISGALATLGTKAAIDFDGSNDEMNHANAIANTGTPLSQFILAQPTGANAYQFLLSLKSNIQNYEVFASSDSGYVDVQFGSESAWVERRVTGFTYGQYKLVSDVYDGVSPTTLTSFATKINNAGVANNAGGGVAAFSGNTSIGNGNGGSFFLDGCVQEIIVYASNQSANESAINTNINTYYGIY